MTAGGMTKPGLSLQVKPVDTGFEGGGEHRKVGEHVLRAIAEFLTSWEADPCTTDVLISCPQARPPLPKV